MDDASIPFSVTRTLGEMPTKVSLSIAVAVYTVKSRQSCATLRVFLIGQDVGHWRPACLEARLVYVTVSAFSLRGFSLRLFSCLTRYLWRFRLTHVHQSGEEAICKAVFPSLCEQDETIWCMSFSVSTCIITMQVRRPYSFSSVHSIASFRRANLRCIYLRASALRSFVRRVFLSEHTTIRWLLRVFFGAHSFPPPFYCRLAWSLFWTVGQSICCVDTAHASTG